MSKSKISPLIAASVMSAVYLAGVSNVTHAVDLQTDAPVMSHSNTSLTEIYNQNSQSVLPAANAAGQRRYIIQFKADPVARYNGVGELPAIPRRADRKIVVDSPAATTYVNHLKQQQSLFVSQLSSQLGRNVNPLMSYQWASNGMAVNLTEREAAQVKGFAEVVSVTLDRDYFLDTDAGPQLIGANNVWTGSAPAAGTALGEGVVIGTLDSGTNFDHPSFADIGDDGFDHVNPLGSGNYLGVCDPANTEQYMASYTCNDKLIGGYDFVNDLVPADGSIDIPGPEDENGHGSHTSSTSGGNVVLTAAANGVENVAISGVAPHATNIHYDICYSNPLGQGLCPGASQLAAVDQVLADGIVDVINYSIGGGQDPWLSATSMAFLSATDSGVFVAASAGNSGPGPGTLGHVEPWTASSGASTHDRTFVNLLSIISAPGDPSVTDIAYNTSNGPAAAGDIVAGIEYAGNIDAGNFEGCNAFPAASFDGLVALISRGACSFELKVDNAFAAGAVAVIIFNNAAGALNMNIGAADDIPSFSILQVDGDALATYLQANAAQTVEILLPAISYTGQADVMAGFSSRGPSPYEYNKPDVTAPGVNILAAFDDSDPALGTAAEYGIISGTSMASPHTAGSAALLKELNPTWTPAEIKSALMLTAVTAGITKEDGVTPADPFDRGAGRVQVDVASSTGLVMNETAFKFLLADPVNGGDPKTLNVASYKNDNCVATCSFTRKFTSVASVPVDYEASLTDMTGTVTPSTFTALPGQTITLDVEIDGAALPAGAVSYGELVIVSTAPNSANPGIAIEDGGLDDAYDGSLGSMGCANISVSGVTTPATGLEVELSMDHTWIGDLVIKLINPNGDILGLLSRPGFAESADDGTSGFGDSTDLLSTTPITFSDAGGFSAELMGGTLSTSEVVCLDDGECTFSPSPGAVVGAATMADLLVTDPNGTWQLCVGDSGGGDFGSLESISLSFDGDPVYVPMPDLHLPLVVTGFPESPDIEVSPESLSATLDVDMSTDLTLTVINTDLAGASLNWSIAANGSGSVVVEQATNGTNGIISDYYSPDITGVYSADDFALLGDTTIETMFFGGFVNNQNLADIATAVEVQIFADDNGVPAGHPEDGLNSALVTLNVPISDPSLDLTDNNIGIDVVAANGSALNLPAGTYWISVFPVNSAAAFATDRWNWFAGFMNNETIAQLVDPSDLFAGGFTDWTGMDVLGVDPTLYGLSYSLGTTQTCGASWLSVNPTSGTVGIDDSTDLTVTVDSTGLTPGVYTAAVCIDSDDAENPRVAVPVTLTVDGPSDLIFANGFEAP